MKSRDEHKAMLDAHHQWPSEYTFKFIVDAEHLPALQALLVGERAQERVSSGGRYVAVTLVKRVGSAEEVLAIYDRFAGVPTLRTL